MSTPVIASELFRAPIILGMLRLLDDPDLTQPKKLAAWIEARLDEGLNVFDHADIYGQSECEVQFGKALSLNPQLKHQVRLITKADIVPAAMDTSPWASKHYNTDGDYIRKAVDATLERLQVERIDCFLLQRPDPLMPVAETARALEDVVKAGKVGTVGVSNFQPEQWRFLREALGIALICNQLELSLLASNNLFNGVHEALQRDGMQVLAWSPMAGGRLAEGLVGETLLAASRETKLSPSALAISWLRRIPGNPIPIIGSFKEARIRDALQGCDYPMPRPLWFKLLEAARGSWVA